MIAKERSEDDRAEIRRRMAIYQRQMELYGEIRYLPNVMDPNVRTDGAEVEQLKEEDD